MADGTLMLVVFCFRELSMVSDLIYIYHHLSMYAGIYLPIYLMCRQLSVPASISTSPEPRRSIPRICRLVALDRPFLDLDAILTYLPTHLPTQPLQQG